MLIIDGRRLILLSQMVRTASAAFQGIQELQKGSLIGIDGEWRKVSFSRSRLHRKLLFVVKATDSAAPPSLENVQRSLSI
jgi:hypothetical protein